jgi:hypothetical protein
MTKPASGSTPYLTVVAASRNDDHGGDPLRRTQILINNFARQCEKYRLPAELIFVDWNPVAGRPGLAGVLQLPPEASYCQARVITVPAVLHDRFKYADRISFFQMIAKNVGIRRARGQFILATNIDIIFSDELMRFVSQQKLDPKKLYRVDRYDIQSGLSEKLSLEETLEYAWANPVRSNRRFEPKALLEHLYGDELFKRNCQPNPKFCRKVKNVAVVSEHGSWAVHSKRDTAIADLHTNACGDFTLLSRAGWEAVRGYAEFAAYSFNIDSLGLAAAHYGGFEEVALLPPCVCFHIEHDLGSGWTPEGENKLFTRLEKNEILNPDWATLMPLVNSIRSGEVPVALNGPSWGLAGFELPDEPLTPGRIVNTAAHPRDYRVPAALPVSALRPDFDLDRLTLWQERRTRAAGLAHLQKQLAFSEGDRAHRLSIIEEQGIVHSQLQAEFDTRLKELKKVYAEAEAFKNERNLLQAQLADLQNNFTAVEKDRAERGRMIESQGKRLANLEGEFDTRLKELRTLYVDTEQLKNERNLLQAQLTDLQRNFAGMEADRIARGKLIEEQGRRTSELERLVWLTEQDRDHWKNTASNR